MIPDTARLRACRYCFGDPLLRELSRDVDDCHSEGEDAGQEECQDEVRTGVEHVAAAERDDDQADEQRGSAQQGEEESRAPDALLAGFAELAERDEQYTGNGKDPSDGSSSFILPSGVDCLLV